MAHDPARPLKLTALEVRKQHQEACREVPCISAKKHKPGCALCVHEGKIIRGEEVP